MTGLRVVGLGRNAEVVVRTEGVRVFALAFPLKVRGRLVSGTTLASESESESESEI